MRPSQAFHVLEKLSNHSTATLRRKGSELSSRDSQTVIDIYQQWLLLMMDLDYLHPDTIVRTGQRLWQDFVTADVLDLNNCCAECLRLIRTQTRKGFKGLCHGISSHLYHLVRNDFELSLQGDVLSAKRLIQLFSYTSRLSLLDIDLTQQLLDDYLMTEENIPSTFDDHLIRRLNKIVRRWMTPFAPDEIVPNHGPGGIAGHGRCSLETKYKDLSTDELLRYAFGAPTWVIGPIRSSLDRISQTIFVPKSYKTFRTISMEPATLQYFQQGVWKAIDHQVSRNSYLRNRIGFHEQLRNQKLAREGSISRNFATIDLSAASDSVSYELVKKMFRGTWVLRYLVALRSRRTLLPDGRIVELKKFAPMGSSLCFPIETIIFASICEAVTREYHVNGRYSVFGDDIIVPTQCVEKVMRLLESLGFRVNRDKSFYQETCWFRESCGGEYLNGFDVTPMRVSRQYASTDRLVRLAKLMKLANLANERGFRFLRYFFVAKLRKTGFKPLFGPTQLETLEFTNYQAPVRWNRRLQRLEVKVTGIVAEPLHPQDVDNQDEAIRYRHWLESTYKRKSLGDGFQSVICRLMVQIKDVWRNKPYHTSDQSMIDSFVRKWRLVPPSSENGKV